MFIVCENNMKKVLFQGNEYNVPDNYKFIAKDNDGQVYVYERRPVWRDEQGDWFGHDCFYVGNVNCLEIL